MSIKELTDGLKRRLSPSLRAFVRYGYLNAQLERTSDGVHTLLNFVEEKFEKEFLAYLKERLDEKEKEEAKACE